MSVVASSMQKGHQPSWSRIAAETISCNLQFTFTSCAHAFQEEMQGHGMHVWLRQIVTVRGIIVIIDAVTGLKESTLVLHLFKVGGCHLPKRWVRVKWSTLVSGHVLGFAIYVVLLYQLDFPAEDGGTKIVEKAVDQRPHNKQAAGNAQGQKRWVARYFWPLAWMKCQWWCVFTFVLIADINYVHNMWVSLHLRRLQSLCRTFYSLSIKHISEC